MKDFLLKFKLKFIRKNAPNEFTHWNESKYHLKFYSHERNSIIIKKPLWLIAIEFIVYHGKNY